MKIFHLLTLIAAILLSSSAYDDSQCTFIRHIKPLEDLNFLVCIINYPLSPQTYIVERQRDEQIKGLLIGGSKVVSDETIFGYFPAVTYYALLNHSIEILHKDNLTELSFLEGLDISKGPLNRIDFDALDDFANLRDLDLSQNQLDYIHPQIFSSLVRLEKLNLNDNKLIALEMNTFTNNRKLETIKLQNNQIIFISPRAFEGLNGLRELYLNGNQCIDHEFKPPRIPALRFTFAQQCKETNEIIEILSERKAEAEGFGEYEDVEETNQ